MHGIGRQLVGLLCSDREILLGVSIAEWLRSTGTAVLLLGGLLFHLFITLCITLYAGTAAAALRRFRHETRDGIVNVAFVVLQSLFNGSPVGEERQGPHDFVNHPRLDVGKIGELFVHLGFSLSRGLCDVDVGWTVMGPSNIAN